ncbi:MAG: ATP-binding protein, partial [Chloroflexi bacterium]|nr:ATP-binding protein [Chloroflexota bacterium]
NNVGKTSLLEAIWFLNTPNLPELAIRINALRGLGGLDPQEPMYELFHGFDPEHEAEIRAFGDWGEGERVLIIKLERIDITQLPIGQPGKAEPQEQEQTVLEGDYSDKQIVLEYEDGSGTAAISEAWIVESEVSLGRQGRMLRSRRANIRKRQAGIMVPARQRYDPRQDADRYGKIEIIGKHRKIENMMRLIEPRLIRLTVITRNSIPILHAEIEGYQRLFPLPLLGDGMVRLSSLALAIGNAEGGIVLVDEIENGLHHTVMKKVWSGIAQFAREFNVQIFATTHSEECVRAAHEAFTSDGLYDFRLHRLERVKDTDIIKAVTYDQETLEAALATGLEVR